MHLPKNLILIRHGESEANVAIAASLKGNHKLFENLKGRHSKTWKLTKQGIAQAKITGKWLIDNGLGQPDLYYVSTHHRAKETAINLGLPHPEWQIKTLLRERDRGLADSLSVEELDQKFPHIKVSQAEEAFLNRFPDGESLADVEVRARLMFKILERQASDQYALIVSHDEVLWTIRVYLENLTLEEYIRLRNSENEHDKIHNGHILHYTRELDKQPGHLTYTYNRVRSICPWDTTKSTNEWRAIGPITYTDEQLKQTITPLPKYVKKRKLKLQAEYKEVSLGRPATFYLPSDYLGYPVDGKKGNCRHVVQKFLAKEYGGYTDEGSGHNGFWKSDDSRSYAGKYQKYVVSFEGKERIPKLKSFLAYIATALGEESIYLETGEDSCLIYPLS